MNSKSKLQVILILSLLNLCLAASTAGAQGNPQDGADATSPDYPQVVEVDGGSVTIHHPVIESWTDFRTLTAWIPLEISLAGSDRTWVGSGMVGGGGQSGGQPGRIDPQGASVQGP